jgi:dual specificity tyrosine-phosphorylation-regulated kinase 2/3/4
LQALKYLREENLIHCDLKPENILLKSPDKSGIKVIDFGSSCFSNQRIYTYIQSRFYRAPEIIMGIPYTAAIDMWSFGCILTELFTGIPLFPGESEQEQLSLIMEVIGLPSHDILSQASRKNVFFDDKTNEPFLSKDSQSNFRIPSSKPLDEILLC